MPVAKIQDRHGSQEQATRPGSISDVEPSRNSECNAKPIFHRGNGLPVGEFKRSWAMATKKAKCVGRLFHDLRRTCARRLLAAGVPQVVARELTGHRTSAMFDRYAIVSSADVLAAQKKVAQFRKILATLIVRVPPASQQNHLLGLIK